MSLGIFWNGVTLPELPQSRRLALLLDDLWADPAVVALWLGGSLARSVGDAYSDIDLRIAMSPEGFRSDAPPKSAARIVEPAVAYLPRKWDDDISQFQILLPDGELYDLVVQTVGRKPAAEARMILACRDDTFAALISEEARDPAIDFPPADPQSIRNALVGFWVGQIKHQKVLFRDLTLVAWHGEHMMGQEMIRLWFVLATGNDCGSPGRMTIHTMTPVARLIRDVYGDSALERLAPALGSQDDIREANVWVRAEVARVGRDLADRLGFEYPDALEGVVNEGWTNFGS